VKNTGAGAADALFIEPLFHRRQKKNKTRKLDELIHPRIKSMPLTGREKKNLK
jgi:hypothetical protein